MKALRALITLATFPPKPYRTPVHPTFLLQFYSAQPQEDDNAHSLTFSDSENGSDSVFDSNHYTLPTINSEPNIETAQQPTWDEKYREKADQLIFGKETQKGKLRILQKEEERKRRVLAKVLLEAALQAADDEVGEEDEVTVVKEEDQKSLSVGIIGAPNAGKSALTNYVVEKWWCGQKLLDPNPKRGTFEAVFLRHAQSTSWLSVPLGRVFTEIWCLRG